MAGLVLSRFPGGRIVIGEGDSAIVVEVVSVTGSRVRLRTIAPKGVRIVRQEVVQIEKARQAAIEHGSEGGGQSEPAARTGEVVTSSEA